MISRTAEYALRAVVYLAEHPREASTAAEIAGGSRAPLGYLVKILVRLGRAGVVASRRGRKGGFVLGRDPGQITMYDIIAACEPPPRVLECPDDGCRAVGTCPLYQRLREAGELEMRYFRGITLRKLLHQRSRCREAARLRDHEHHGATLRLVDGRGDQAPATYADDPAAGGDETFVDD